MTRMLETLGRHGAILLAASIVAGLALPDLAALLRPALAPSVYGMLAIAMTRVDVLAIRHHLATPGRIAGAFLWINAALPVAIGLFVLLLGARLGMTPGLAFALVLISASPPIISSSAISYLLGLDGALSLAILLIATALTPIVAPVMVYLWMGPEFAISPWSLGIRLALLIGGSCLAAFALRRLLGRARIAAGQGTFDGLNVALMVIFAIGLMDGISARFLAAPAHFLTLVATVFAITLGMFAVTTVVFRRLGPRLAGTVGYSAGFRNIALAIGALAGAVPDDTWTMFAVIQFPIYLSPLILKPVCRWLMRTPAAT